MKTWLAAGVCLALLGGIAAWHLAGRETAAPCNGLSEDTRVRQSVGAGLQPGMNCAAVGKAIVQATSGSAPGRHTQAQAQAMKDVLFALGSGSEHSKELDLDPGLRVPLATALADFAPDLHEMLAGLDSQYAFKAGHDILPWESGGTYHLSVHNNVFRTTLRAVAEDLKALALLRMAETRTAAQRLAAVPADATGTSFSLPPTANARALGILDGIADAVTHDEDPQQAQKWRRVFLDRILSERATPHSYQDDPAGYLTVTWLQELVNAPEANRPEHLRSQGVDMARAWTQARNTDESTRQELPAQVERSALNACREVGL
ncbi:hypothetical protein [Streptomyces sp. G-G2]|uniref:hypothetical protein n=1 Tax=Streptomyces sp. G-G2 TaxID=3046201 RepID=UPI0024BB7955|nr:hypothetical protein [Streptomyces sp. G-G2]MDJ0384560.1 hypothetical protein [Streptomyces sp. G-G2]